MYYNNFNLHPNDVITIIAFCKKCNKITSTTETTDNNIKRIICNVCNTEILPNSTECSYCNILQKQLDKLQNLILESIQIVNYEQFIEYRIKLIKEITEQWPKNKE